MNKKGNVLYTLLAIWAFGMVFGAIYFIIIHNAEQSDLDKIDYKEEYYNLQQELNIMDLDLRIIESSLSYYKQLLQICEGELYFARYNNYTIEYLDIPNSTLKMQVIYGEDIANITLG